MRRHNSETGHPRGRLADGVPGGGEPPHIPPSRYGTNSLIQIPGQLCRFVAERRPPECELAAHPPPQPSTTGLA
jgi:hypothetical protein